MVILLQCDMDGDGHRSSRKSVLFKWVTGRSSRPSPPGPRRRSGQREIYPPTERRPLRSVPFVGPHYRVEPEILVTEFVEKEVKFLGTVSDLDCNFDATDRVSLLKIVDEQQALDFLPCHLSYENDIIVSFSVHNIKLLRRDGEKIIHRIQTHKISAVGYVRDDQQHLVFIKFASELNPKMCNLAILCCASKTAAEEVCSLAQQLFQLVYTDSTIDFLDKSIMDGAITPKNHSYSTDDSDKKDTVTVRSGEYAQYSLRKSADSLISPTTSSRSTNGHAVTQQNPSKRRSMGSYAMSDVPAGSSSTLPQPLRRTWQHRRSGSSGSSSNNNVPPVTTASTLMLTSPTTSTQNALDHGELQIQDYLRVLREQLTNEEMKEFAQLLYQFRTHVIMIQEFSNKVLLMYTEERKRLLLGMRHFIPNESDLSFFNNFLRENNVKDEPVGSASTSWWAQAPRTAPRTLSETEESNTSATGNVTAVSLSSSGSERASASVVSNDDSGEWKDVMGNIEKLGLYPSTDSSAGAEPVGNLKKVNGSPSKSNSNSGIMNTSIFKDDLVSAAYAARVAEVPEGFRDGSSDDEEQKTVSSFSSIKKSPTKPVEDNDKQSKTSESVKKKERGKSESDTSFVTTTETDHKRTYSEQQRSLKKTMQFGESNPVSASAKRNEGVRPEKEHRKKKKHKKTELEAKF